KPPVLTMLLRTFDGRARNLARPPGLLRVRLVQRAEIPRATRRNLLSRASLDRVSPPTLLRAHRTPAGGGEVVRVPSRLLAKTPRASRTLDSPATWLDRLPPVHLPACRTK